MARKKIEASEPALARNEGPGPGEFGDPCDRAGCSNPFHVHAPTPSVEDVASVARNPILVDAVSVAKTPEEMERDFPGWSTMTALEKAHATMKARREAGEVIERLTPIERARRKPTSLRLAVTAKCWECVGGDGDPNPRKRIRECTLAERCPLHPVRPYQKKAGADEAEDLETEVETDDGEG